MQMLTELSWSVIIIIKLQRMGQLYHFILLGILTDARFLRILFSS